MVALQCMLSLNPWKVGEECIIFLPAIPLEETRLPEPLKTVNLAKFMFVEEN